MMKRPDDRLRITEDDHAESVCAHAPPHPGCFGSDRCCQPASRAASRRGRERSTARSARSRSTCRKRTSSTCAAASRATRWPDRETVDDRSQGNQLGKLQDIVRYWGTDYDWRKVEAQLNALPMFMTEIDGVDIHFIHVKSRHANALAADHHARLARFGDRAAEGHRAADQSDGPRRPGGGCVRRRDPVDARLRLLRQADRHGVESGAHRARLGRADAAPRLHPLCRAGRRLGLSRLQRDGAPGAGGIARHPHQPAGDGTARGGRGARRRRARACGTLREGTRGVQLARHVLKKHRAYARDHGHAAADDRLRLDGFSGGACGLDLRLQQRRTRAPARQTTRCSTTSRCTG